MIQTLVWTQHGAGVSPVNQSHYFITISTSENSPASLIVTAAPRLLTIADWWEVPLIHFSYCTFISEIEIFATVYILWGKYDQVWCVYVYCVNEWRKIFYHLCNTTCYIIPWKYLFQIFFSQMIFCLLFQYFTPTFARTHVSGDVCSRNTIRGKANKYVY